MTTSLSNISITGAIGIMTFDWRKIYFLNISRRKNRWKLKMEFKLKSFSLLLLTRLLRKHISGTKTSLLSVEVLFIFQIEFIILWDVGEKVLASMRNSFLSSACSQWLCSQLHSEASLFANLRLKSFQFSLPPSPVLAYWTNCLL